MQVGEGQKLDASLTEPLRGLIGNSDVGNPYFKAQCLMAPQLSYNTVQTP